MSHKVAKKLRKAMGYKPGKTEYVVPPTRKVVGHDGKAQGWITGTIQCDGLRRRYQAVKRRPVLTKAILAAHATGGM